MQLNTTSTTFTIGLDLGDTMNTFCILDKDGKISQRGSVSNDFMSMSTFLKDYRGARLIIETGTSSPWISRLAKRLGLDVLVGQSRKLRAIYQNPRKDDAADAELLARMGRFDPKLLQPIEHRSEQAQAHLCIIRSRDQLVKCRSSLITQVRSQVKVFGERLPACTSPAFHHTAEEHVPEYLRPAIEPVLASIEELTRQIRVLEGKLDKLAKEIYPETMLLRQIKGVGPITALSFVLTLDRPERFKQTRLVGAWLGLTPRRDQSGETDRELGISKAGNSYLRTLLIEASRYILGPFGEDCRLRRFGLRLLKLPPAAPQSQISEKSSKAKNRAIVAIARKLSVLLLSLWKNGDDYDPLYRAA